MAPPMIGPFAAEERDSKRRSPRDPLAVLIEHIDFVAIAAAVDATMFSDTEVLCEGVWIASGRGYAFRWLIGNGRIQ